MDAEDVKNPDRASPADDLLAEIRHTGHKETLLLIAVVALAVGVMTWPLPVQVFTHVAYAENDPEVNVTLWDFWWFQHPFENWLTNPFECSAIFYPLGAPLVYHGAAVLYALVTAPIGWVLGVVPALNAITLFTFFTSALTCYWLARYLGLGRHGAFVAALIFAFSPFRLWRMGHQTPFLATDWMAAYGLCLMAMLSARRWWLLGIVAGACWACCTYVDATFSLILGILSLVFFLAFFRPRREPARTGRVVGGLALAGLTAALLTSPLLMALHDVQNGFNYYVEGDNIDFSADLLGFIIPPETSLLWGKVASGLTSVRYAQEGVTFLGFLAAALALIGLLRKAPDKRIRFWKIAFLVFLVLSLGPFLKIGGKAQLFELRSTFDAESYRFSMPAALFSYVPILNNARAAVRFHGMTTLPFALLAGLGFTVLSGLVSSARVRTLAAGLVVALCLSEYAVFPIETFRPSWDAFQVIRDDPDDVTVLDSKLDSRTSLLNQVGHGKPIISGHISRIPPEVRGYVSATPVVRQFCDKTGAWAKEVKAYRKRPDARGMTANVVDLLNIRYFVINSPEEDFKRAIFDGFVPFSLAAEDGPVKVYRLDPRPREGVRPKRIMIGEGEWSAYLANGWGQWRRSSDIMEKRKSIWPESPEAVILFRTDEPATVRFQFDVFTPESSKGAQMEVAVNGHPVKTDPLQPGHSTVGGIIPPECVVTGLNRVQLRWPYDKTNPVWGEHADALARIMLASGATGKKFVSGTVQLEGQPRLFEDRGYWLIQLSPDGRRILDAERFDPYANTRVTWERFVEAIDALPEGRLVAFLSVNEASKEMTQEAVDALGRLGSAFDMREKKAWCHAGVGMKGLEPGQALEYFGEEALHFAPTRCAFLDLRFSKDE